MTPDWWVRATHALMLEGYSKTDIAPSWRQFVRYWFLPDTVRRALALACVVGPILTVINQPEALLALDFNTRVVAKIALTFVVPYAVSSYSSAQALMRGGSR